MIGVSGATQLPATGRQVGGRDEPEAWGGWGCVLSSRHSLPSGFSRENKILGGRGGGLGVNLQDRSCTKGLLSSCQLLRMYPELTFPLPPPPPSPPPPLIRGRRPPGRGGAAAAAGADGGAAGDGGRGRRQRCPVQGAGAVQRRGAALYPGLLL